MASSSFDLAVNFSAVGAQNVFNEIEKVREALGDVRTASEQLNKSLGGEKKTNLAYKIVVDDSGVKQLVFFEKTRLTVLDKANQELAKARALQDGSVTSLRQQVNQAKQLRDQMARYGASVDGIFTKVGKSNGAWEAQNARVRDLQKQLDIAGASNIWQRLTAEYNLGGLANAGRQVSELVNVFQSVSIIVGQVIGSVNQLFDVLQKLQSIELTFQGIGAGTDISQVFAESNRIALGLGVSLNTVRDSFQQLSPVILATGGNIGDVSAVTESLSSRFVTFGLSADKSRRVLNGVVQAFSKGKLMAEELTQQISEADPAFRTDLAEAIGVTVKELGDMVKAGQVTNDVLLEAIPRMSKVGGLFGNLGTTALDAAKGFRAGTVTVEQFRNQLSNIGQLAIEDLVNPDTGPLQPLLSSLLELTAIVTDVTVAFAKSEIFETFLTTLGSVVSQVSLVVQALVAIGSAIASITQPIFAVINFVDKLGGVLEGFGVISTAVAGIITTKLLVALGGLAAGAATSAAIAGIGALTSAINFLASGSVAQLVGAIGRSIASFIGLGVATKATAVAEGVSTAATGVRATAVANLTRLLGFQAGADLAAAKAAGINATAQGAAAAVATTKGGVKITGDVAEIGTSAGAAVGNVDKLKGAVAGLGRSLTGLLANPYVLLFGALAVAVGVTIAKTNSARESVSKFDAELKKIRSSVDGTNKALDAAKGADSFTARLDRLDEAVKKNSALNSSGQGAGFGALFGDDDGYKIALLINGAKRIGTEVTAELGKATQAVDRYSEANDKTGNNGLKVAAQVAAAESTVAAALRITGAEREKLIAEQEKAPGLANKESVAKIRLYDAEIKKLEQQKVAIAKVKEEAKKKGVPVTLELDKKEAETKLATFSEQIKGLKASIILESDPGERAKLQGELNALEAQLKFIQDNPIEVKIEAEFKVKNRELKDAADLAKNTQDALQAAADLGQSLFKFDIGKVSGAEEDVNRRIEELKDELDRLEDAGVKEGAATKGLEGQITKEEEKLKQLAEDKRQIEIKAIEAKLNALPAIQAAEAESLKLQQKMARLELERLKAASTRAKIEGIQLANEIIQEGKRAAKRGDTEGVADANNRLATQSELLRLLTAEESSLGMQLGTLNTINRLQNEALGSKQAAQVLDLQSELAAKGTAAAQGQVSNAANATAVASGNSASNARAFAELSRQAAGYTESGAEAARREAESKEDARKAAEGLADAGINAVTPEAQTATENAARAGGDLDTNLGNAANEAQKIVDGFRTLDGSIVSVKVNYVGQPGLWTGGPTVGGQTYRINELGREGFLSSTGTLSAINKPRNALWKAPGRGTVIPAHIMSGLDIPTGRVSTGVRPAAIGAGGNGMGRLVRAIQNALTQTNKSDPGLQEMASVQAHQAQEIGKLSRAVTKLADKDWNVNVGVRNTGSTAYLDALNRRM